MPSLLLKTASRRKVPPFAADEHVPDAFQLLKMCIYTFFLGGGGIGDFEMPGIPGSPGSASSSPAKAVVGSGGAGGEKGSDEAHLDDSAVEEVTGEGVVISGKSVKAIVRMRQAEIEAAAEAYEDERGKEQAKRDAHQQRVELMNER